MGDKSAALNFSGKESDYKVMSGSVGPDVIDIRKLYANTGAFQSPGLQKLSIVAIEFPGAAGGSRVVGIHPHQGS